jgi:ABC-type transport system involved in multi-copper enzyme maturation permease subunit
MNKFYAVLWCEILKVRRSRIFPGSIFFFILVASMMGLVMFIQIYPEVSGKLGLIGNKASMMRFGEPNWKNYFTLLMMGFAAVGLVGSGFITAWTFGREFSDHTLKDILVVPVSRTFIVLAKSIVIIVWSFILCIVYFISGLLIGFVIGLPGYSSGILVHGTYDYLVTAFLILPLFTPTAFLASYSRGYILPLGFVILTLIIANFSGLVGMGPYFPWAIPGLYGVPSETGLHSVSYIILFVTGLAGFYATTGFWKYADQK